mgnify:CR=1 FL=1
MGASLRYLSQRYSMPYPELKGLLTDIGTEELGHLEIIGTIVHQLTRNLSEEDIRQGGFDAYFVDHTAGVYPTAASGFPWNAASMAVKGDLIADLTEDLAAEQKARVTYDNILRLSDDPDVNDVIKFLRAREIVHFQRFGEAKREVSSKYPGSGKPTPAPFCNRKTKIQKMYELKPDLGVLLPTSNAPFSFHK